MNYSNQQLPRPQWMNDELVKDIPQEKLDLLSKMFANSHGKSQKELMMMMVPLMKEIKEKKLSFTQDEMTAAINAIKKYSTQEELSKINNILHEKEKRDNR